MLAELQEMKKRMDGMLNDILHPEKPVEIRHDSDYDNEQLGIGA